MWYQLLITENEDAKYCDEEGVKPLGDFIVDLPDTHLGKDRKVYFELCFGEMEIQAYAKNGFSFAHISNPVVATNDEWPEQDQTSTSVAPKYDNDNSENVEYWDQMEKLKTNTVLKYDDIFENVEYWGFPALTKISKQKEENLVELFKLHLCDKKPDEPFLPEKLTYKKVITDYFNEMVKKTVTTRWPGIEYNYQVLFVLAVPAEFPENSKVTLRESEAAAIYCLDTIETKIQDYIGKSFLVVDCGGGTVDLTIRKLLKFIKFLETKIGNSAIDNFKKDHYGQYQLLIHEFCRNVKLPFTGIEEDYKNYELDIKRKFPSLKKYINNDNKLKIKFTFEDVKKMFDPVISEVIKLIREQLDHDETCSTMFLVGGFSESKYLQKRIEEEFINNRIKHILVPQKPIAAVARGAVKYGINKKFIKNRVLKYTYGRSTLRPYDESIDPPERKRESGHVLVFKSLAKKGTIVEVDQKFSQTSHPENSDQSAMWYQILITENEDAKYCDEEGVKPLGDFIIDLPDTHLGKDRKVYFELCFGEMEIQAYAKNVNNGLNYKTTFNYSN
ncbi:hypothetical protein C1645_813429 [Glomus cerebriforme]|uniref:Actin-like ATPase domain-containing protein n=1 Tax=Glomus cerebriforme TaxID=658196 RepID=A0A397TLU2_9GLOM|nr:hypothetical protein C1645_813429 [Glomus cerebriforme]